MRECAGMSLEEVNDPDVTPSSLTPRSTRGRMVRAQHRRCEEET
jgi:hypothetical protein